MQKWMYWLVLIMGVLLVLPLLGVDQLGTATSGLAGWVIALAVLAIGALNLK